MVSSDSTESEITITAVMCVSRSDFHGALATLFRNDPDEVITAVTTNKLASSVGEMVNPDEILLRNTDHPWEAYGKYDCFDSATSDWIVVMDDDDTALESYRPHLRTVPEDVAIVFGDQDRQYRIMRNDQEFTKSNTVHRCCDYYAIRRDAWDEISRHMDTSVSIHDPARVMYWALDLGWEYEYIPEVVQIKRNTAGKNWGAYTRGWGTVYQALESGQGTEAWLKK